MGSRYCGIRTILRSMGLLEAGGSLTPTGECVRRGDYATAAKQLIDAYYDEFIQALIIWAPRRAFSARDCLRTEAVVQVIRRWWPNVAESSCVIYLRHLLSMCEACGIVRRVSGHPARWALVE